MNLAIVGLALSGKTTAFNALTRGHAPVGTFGGEAEIHLGSTKIPDERLDKLSAFYETKSVVYADINYTDIPGALAYRGGGRGEGPGPQAQAALDRCDALVHVVRAFRNAAVPHPEGSVDAARDIDAMNLELVFADLGIVERRLERLDTVVRSARPGDREAGEREMVLLKRVKEGLEKEKPLHAQGLPADELRQLANYNLLTTKPVLVVLNIDEEDIPRAQELEEQCRSKLSTSHAIVVALCGRLEMELNDLSAEEAAEFRADLGIGDAALARVARLCFELLGLSTFYTGSEVECRAWPIEKDTSAAKAAGEIHSDLERGFIRAEVIHLSELLACGSQAEAKRRGLLRGEGKSYPVKDGDVLHILFNV